MTKTEKKKLILLVDDAPVNIHIAREILKDLYGVRIATSGAMALEVVQVPPPPDLILLDIMMPEMDGYEVCTRLKADPCTREIPVIFLTAMTETMDETRGFAVGAVDYIHKPFSPSVVLARVHTHLELSETRERLIDMVLGAAALAQANVSSVHAETLEPSVARLKSLLEVNDGAAVEAMQQVTDALAGEVDANVLAALRKSVNEYDFREALERLCEIGTTCKPRLDARTR